MDFPKKQQQCLIPKYLLDYTGKLFDNHPDPTAPWGGGGDYEAGYGIDITSDTISVDTDVIATKSDISSMVTTTMLEDALDDYALKTDLPENVSDLNNDAGYITSNALTGYATESWVSSQGYLTSTDLSGYATESWVNNQGFISSTDLSNYVTSTDLTNTLSNYALSSTVTNLASQVTTLESLVSGHTSQISTINSNITDLQTLTSTHTSQISGINSSITDLSSLVNTNTSNISTIQSTINNYDLTHPFDRVTEASALGPNGIFFGLSSTRGEFYRRLEISQPGIHVNLTALNPIFSNGLTASYDSNYGELNVGLDSSITSSITTLESLTSTHTSQISTLSSSITTLEGLVSTNTSNISALQTSVSNCVTLSQLSSTLSDYTPTSGLASVATTGNYNDLTSKPSIPSYSLSKTFETWTFTLTDDSTITKSMLMDVSLISS